MLNKKAFFAGCFLGCMVAASACFAQMKTMSETELNSSVKTVTNGKAVPSTEEAFLYLDKKNYLYTAEDGRNYDFYVDKGELVVADEARRESFTRLIPLDYGGVAYAIKPMYIPQAKQYFVQVIADVGAHAKNCGYWLLGLDKGAWINYISVDSLASQGYNPKDWHRIDSKLEDGYLIIETGFEYLPKGAQFSYQMKYALDNRYKAVWDEKTHFYNLEKMALKKKK